MLKRHQVLLNEWLTDYIRCFCERYDLSFSELIRIMLCLQIGSWVSQIYPKYKFKISLKEISNLLEAFDKTHDFEEKHHKMISRVYFETRKAAEFILTQLKKEA